LYDLTRTLAANNIYIASAVIATYGAQVVDTFYVKDMFGLKLHTRIPSKRRWNASCARPSPGRGAGKARMKPDPPDGPGFLTVGAGRWSAASRASCAT
jgi:hypothetical protein